VQARIGTHEGDLWKDPFPSADVHFYSMIFHDWPPEECRFLAKKSFDSLGPGGRIIVREMLFNNDRAGPFPVEAFNIDMLLWVEGEQNSGREISSMLREAGFKNIDCAGSPSWIICSHLTPSRTLRIASRSLVRADSSRDRLRSAAGGIGTPGSAVGSIAEGTT
jgi:hypothetical protein